MFEYKTIKCDLSKLVDCDKSKEEYIMSNFVNSIIEWTIDVNNGYVTLEEETSGKIKSKKIKIKDWDYYKKFAPTLEKKWYNETVIGFETKLNELGEQGFELISSDNGIFIFMKRN